jgi:hypothetical protein
MGRAWAAILVGLLLVASLGLILVRRRSIERADTEAERERRVTSLVEVAPAPLPSSLPMIGAEGDAEGYFCRPSTGPRCEASSGTGATRT